MIKLVNGWMEIWGDNKYNFSQGLGRKHSLSIQNDRRQFIPLSTFGFYTGGEKEKQEKWVETSAEVGVLTGAEVGVEIWAVVGVESWTEVGSETPAILCPSGKLQVNMTGFHIKDKNLKNNEVRLKIGRKIWNILIRWLLIWTRKLYSVMLWIWLVV